MRRLDGLAVLRSVLLAGLVFMSACAADASSDPDPTSPIASDSDPIVQTTAEVEPVLIPIETLDPALPAPTVVEALGLFAGCLEDLAVRFLGPPDPRLPATAAQNEASYVRSIQRCAGASLIVEAIAEEADAEAAMSAAEVAGLNFRYLAFRDCLIERGWAAPTDPIANDAGSLVNFVSDDSVVPPNPTEQLAGVTACSSQPPIRSLTSTCADLDHGDNWALTYEAELIDGVMVLRDFATPTNAPGEWTFEWIADEKVTREHIEPSVAGVFDLEIAAHRATALAPGGECRLLIRADRGEGFARVAIVGDSNIAALAVDFSMENNFDVDVRAWSVVGESGGGWIRLPEYESSGPFDEVRGALASDLDVLVLNLGVNDALLWGLAQPGSEESEMVAASSLEALDGVLALAADVPCVLIPGATTEPTTSFGAGEAYAISAEALGESLREAADSRDDVHVTDWVELSGSHHLADGEPGDWFVADDIHLTSDGRLAFVEHITEAIDRYCPEGSATEE